MDKKKIQRMASSFMGIPLRTDRNSSLIKLYKTAMLWWVAEIDFCARGQIAVSYATVSGGMFGLFRFSFCANRYALYPRYSMIMANVITIRRFRRIFPSNEITWV